METILKLLEDDQVELSVTIPTADVDKAVKEAYAEAAKNRIKGFRQGKAPRNVLDKVYGGPDFFLAEATDVVIKASYLKAIDSLDMIPLDQPDLGDIIPVVEGSDYQYAFTFPIAPVYTLSSYQPVQIELPSVEPTVEEIQSRIDSMMGYYVEYVEVTDRASQKGDVITLEMQVTHNGETVQSMSGENVPFELGIDAMPADFEDHFIGIKAGDHVSVDFKLPYYDGDEDNQDQDLHAEATLKKIEVKKRPELTDEWVKEKLEYESIEHFRQLLADSIKSQKESALPALKERRVAEAIAERLQGDPPASITSGFAQDIYRDIFTSLQRQGITLDVFLASTGQTPETFREEVQSQAESNARQAMALDAYALHIEAVVSDDDIQAEFVNSGGEEAQALFDEWTEVGRISEIRQGIRRMKASRLLNEEAIVTEEKPGDKAEKAEKASKTDKAGKAEKASKTDKADKTVKADKAVVVGEVDEAEKAEKAVILEKADNQKLPKAKESTKLSLKAENKKSQKPIAAPKAAKKTGGPKKV
ncbi:MAG: trigger factor [Coriobacteriales bacterium]|nr:trigger factor [Coriobacteriales bacterium]